MSEWADFAAELAGAVTEQDVLAVLGEMIGPLAGAQLVNIALLDPDGHTMRLVEARGMRAEVASQLATYDLRILRPSTEALASGEVVLLRTPDDLDRRFPEVAGTPLDQTSLAVAPLGPRDRPLGVLSLGWVREQTFDPDQVQGIRQLATICGAAMERAQAHHRESEARLDAQRTAQRLADLYALTTRLAAATSATEVATTLIEVCLPMLSASAATITIYDGLRRPRLLAATGIPGVEDILFGGSDPEDLPGAEAYAQLSAVRQMVRDRRPVLVTSAADRRLRYPDLVADEGVQEAWANLPLVVGDRLVGIVAFGWDDPRWFDAEETSFLSSVAAHTAIALDRALSLQAAESAVARMRTLQEVTAGLATAATIEEIAGVLVERGVRMVATFGVVAVLDREARVWRRFSSQNLPPAIAEGLAVIPVDQSDLTPITTAARVGRMLVFESLEEMAGRHPQAARYYASTGSRSTLCVPILIGERSIGALGFGFERPGPVSLDHRVLAQTLASLAGPALERAEQYEAEYRAAHQLQAALLPDLPGDLPGVRAGGCYVPATTGREIGGDWYDVFEIPGNRIGLCVGDIVGHDLAATTVMMKVQPLLRSHAQSGGSPAQLLETLDGACEWMPGALCSTVGYADYSPAMGVLRIASAGHPPALLLTPGRAQFLDVPPGPPLGVAMEPRRDHELTVPDGAMLIWYSDGLIERRGRSLQHGLDQLLGAAAGIARDPAFERLAPGEVAERLRDLLTSADSRADDLVVTCAVLGRTVDSEGSVVRAGLDAVRDLAGVRRRLRRWGEQLNLEPATVDAVIQVATEMATNALEHPRFASDPRAELTVDQVDVDRVRVQVTDHGRWREASDGASERGRGLAIVSELAQNTTIELRPDGTRVTAIIRHSG
ncbi:MAG: GAF domain-containing protein [Kineosporiaceae bacterium]|nr:GAF domain-containing protein [Kineosporiaceae bacterium]